MNEVSENIVILRKQSQMSQGDLAKLLFVTPQAVSRWERGETEPDIDTLKKMAEIFKVSVEEIIYGPTSKLSKKMRIIMHTSYLVFSILMLVLSIISVFLVVFDVDYIAILIAFISFIVVYFAFLMVCEVVQSRLKKIPVRKENTK